VFFFIWFKKEKLFSSNMFLFEINNSTVASSGWRLSSLSNGRDSYWILSAKVSVVWGAAAQSPPAGKQIRRRQSSNDPTRTTCAQLRALAGPRSSLHLE
jgi:hypothetical protein